MPTPGKVYYDDLERLLDEEIYKVFKKRQSRRKARSWFSISNTGFCPRAAILNRLNAKETEPNEKQLRTFWLGNIIHDAIRGVVEKSGKLVAAEEFVSTGFGPDASDLVGCFDFILRTAAGKNILYEMKSTGPGSFWNMVLKAKEPNHHHVMQALCYWIKNKKYEVDVLKVSYINKLDASVRSWTVKVTPDLIAEVNDWWDMVRGHHKRRELPAPYDKDSQQYKDHYCDTCFFNTHYCFPAEGQEAQVKQNLLELQWEASEQVLPAKEEVTKPVGTVKTKKKTPSSTDLKTS